MALYHYKAADPDGTVLEGEMDAANHAAVIRRLQAAGHIPLRAEVVAAGRDAPTGRAWFTRRRVTRRDVALLTVELATLLEAGMSLDRALGMLLRLASQEPLRRMLTRVHAAIREGEDFSAALDAEGGAFPPYYRNMVRAGEASGTLEITLARLADFMERSNELRETVVSAMIYPLILIVLSGLSVILMLTFVVPQFATMFEDAGQALPLPTRIVLLISDAVLNYWWALALAMVLIYLWVRRELGIPASRLRLDRRLLRTPLVGDLVAAFETARFTRTLGTLLTNGVTLLNALAIAREAVHNRFVAQALARVTASVREGRGLAGPLSNEAVLPPLVGQMLQVGEESGNLDAVLMRLADIYEREVRSTVRRLMALLEPALILGLGLLIAGIILSILAAILRVNDLAF